MAITRPTNIQKPFAVSGTKNVIPVPSQIGITNGAASFTDGFPPLTFTPIAAGGVPPSGADFNGILNILSAHVMLQNAGDLYYYDATLATAIGGYDKGALLLRTDNTGFWFNTTAGNSTAPDAGGAGWVPAYNYGLTAITGLTNANVTLTQAQYSKTTITLAGTLTGNINIIFPAFIQNWVIQNNTTGSYVITAKTAAGTGVTVPKGLSSVIWGDGTNINTIQPSLPTASTSVAGIIALLDSAGFLTGTDATKALTASLFAKSLGSSGYITLPGGLIFQWGNTTIPDDSSVAVTLPVAFSSAEYAAYCTRKVSANIGNSTVYVAANNTSTTTITLYTYTATAVSTDAFWFAIGK